jgi:hypothetical protein
MRRAWAVANRQNMIQPLARRRAIPIILSPGA